MDLVRTNEYRLLPNAKQKAMLDEFFNLYRFAFNNVLGKIQDAYFGTYEVQGGKNKGSVVPKIPNQTGIVGFSTKLKEEYEFLHRLPNDYLQSSLSNLYLGMKEFIKQPSRGYPKFKSKKTSKKAFGSKAGSRIKVEDNYIILSKPKGTPYTKEDFRIRFKKHQTNHEIGKITSFTISKDNLGLYWVTITYKISIDVSRKTTGSKVGIDLGLKKKLTTSDGLTIENHKYTKKYEKRLKKYQRRLSKKKKGSKNRNKARLKVAKTHRKIRNTRNHHNHVVSKTLVNLYDFIALETLQVKGMLKNRRLSKAIQDVAWADLVQKIEYKANENQVSVSKISTWFPSSKLCSCCGSIKETLSLEERTYKCDECGFELDRDLNAAINILEEGLRQS